MNRGQKKEFHPEFFKNTLKINIGKNNISRKDVVDGLKLVIDLKKIDNICQYKSREFWYVAFIDFYNPTDLINKEIIIKNFKFTFEHAIKQSIFKCFKISWLPPKFNKIDQIAHCLCAGQGEVKKISQLKDSDGLNLNIYNISIEYPINNKVDFISITGKQQAFGETIFITRYGDPVWCVYCEEFGHKKSDCKKYQQICKECGKRGHTVCTMAHKIAVEEEENEIDVEDDEAKIEEKKKTTENGSSQATTSTVLTQKQESIELKNSIKSEETSNKNKNEAKNESSRSNESKNKNLKNQKKRNQKETTNKWKATDTTGSGEKQIDKKINNQDNDNTSNNSSFNDVDLDIDLTEEDVNKIAIVLSKQLD